MKKIYIISLLIILSSQLFGVDIVANAGEDKTLNITPSHKAIHLDGRESSSENKIVSYKWYEGDKYIGAGKSRWYVLTQSGKHNITLKIVDEIGEKSEDSISITVMNSDDLVNLSEANDLKANAGEDKTLNITPSHKAIHLDGSKSSSENKIVSYKWCEGDKYIGAGVSRWYILSKNGEHNITLEVVDERGKKAKDSVIVTVVNGDDVNIKKCDKSTAITRDELRMMIANDEDVTEVNTCMITDMSHLVYPNVMFFKNDSILTREQKNNIKNFNQDISGWDVSNVTNMKGMFHNAIKFNQPIGSWDVSRVSNMDYMFTNAKVFNQPIGSWDVSSVGVIGNHHSGMDNMFYGATEFNQDIKDWDISGTLDLSLYYEYDENNYIIKNGNYGFAEDSALEDEYNPFLDIHLSDLN